MKFLTAIITLAASTTFAAPKTEILNIRASISLDQLHCEIGDLGSSLPTNERLITVLPRPYIITGLDDSIELEHKRFATVGCNLPILDKLVSDSVQTFGYLQHAPVRVTKDTSTSRRAGNGECFARFTETVFIDIGNDITLKSETIIPVLMNDCPAI